MLPVTHAVLLCRAESYAHRVAGTDLSNMCGCVPAAPANGRGEEGSLYQAESWAAIGAFLFGPDPSKALTPHPGSGPGTKSGIKVRLSLQIPATLPKSAVVMHHTTYVSTGSHDCFTAAGPYKHIHILLTKQVNGGHEGSCRTASISVKC